MNQFHFRSRSLLVLLAGVLAIAAATLLLLPGRATPAVNTTLTAYISDAPDKIWLKDASGAIVTYLAPGTYTIAVTDASAYGNFHLTGPGVDLKTGLGEIENVTWTVTLTEGHYHYNCDYTPRFMFGDFTVGNTPPPPPPPPPPPSPPPPARACVVPNVKGKPLGKARTTLAAARCSTGAVRRAFTGKVKMGRVMSQRPSAGTHLRKGGKVNLVVSRGRSA